MRNYFKLPLLALALAMPGTGFTKSFPKEKDPAAYLMVFHRDDTHGLYMAMSRERRKTSYGMGTRRSLNSYSNILSKTRQPSTATSVMRRANTISST